MKLFTNLLYIISIIAVGSLATNLSYASPGLQQQEPKTKKERVDSLVLKGKIFNRLTSHILPYTVIEVLRSDSTPISAVEAGWKGIVWTKEGEKEDSTSDFCINIPKIEDSYIIRVSKRGYETKYVPYILSNLKRRENEREAPKIYLSPERVRTLEEFTVKTSKIKFYHKGDTLVYNADAFMLPEGSMLDALITQLPGVEIRDGGKIYVNGRFVESLLLNGKDFFKKDKNVMLENIGVYAVKDIAVYEKKGDLTEILGDRGDIENEYVMDVRLKKEYRIGTMINAEAGGGTNSRYLGRLFAMRYTDNSRVALYGNANNINRMNRLTSAEDQFEQNSKGGITKKANGGIDYYVDNAFHTWELSGNADINYTDRNNTVITNAINYIQTKDNFDFSNIRNRAKEMAVSTYHNFKLKDKRWNMALKPSFSYNKTRNNDETIAATFNRELQDMNENIVKSIYSGDYRNIQSALINRNLKAYEADSHGYEAQLQGSSRIKIPNSPDALEVKFTAQYKRNSLFGNTLQDICFGAVPEASLLQQRFSSNRPQYNFKIQGLGRYYFNIPFGSLNASYEFIHTQNRKNSDIALLEAMAENDMAQFEPGAIPEPDFDNSYTSKLYKNQHTIKLVWIYKKKMAKVEWQLNFEPKFFLERHDLYYHRYNIYQNPAKTFTRFNIENSGFSIKDRNQKWSFRAIYSMKQTAPNLLSMVDINNTSDPLNVRLGNPDLKTKTDHEITFLFRQDINRNIYHNAYLDLFFYSNDFTEGYTFNSNTGVRTFRTYNVSGNKAGTLAYTLGVNFGPQKNFMMYNELAGNFNDYSNMIGFDADPMKQQVKNRSLDESLRLGYGGEKFGINLKTAFNYTRSVSEVQLHTKSNYGNVSVGLDGGVQLPLNFQLQTDFNMIKRFGYIENSMNDINYIWNASLEYLIQKGTWRISLDAKDILNQNKGINYYVNASGRTQTLNTVLPRYLMLSVHYRFDFKPKKRAK